MGRKKVNDEKIFVCTTTLIITGQCHADNYYQYFLTKDHAH